MKEYGMCNPIESPPHPATVFAEIRRTLTESVDLAEIKNIRDQAEAIRHYVQTAALGLEMQNQAAEIKLIAERRAGTLLASLHLRGGDRKSEQWPNNLRLAELGISREESSRWQREALLPEEEFQEYLRQRKQQGKELTSDGLLRLARLRVETTRRDGQRDIRFATLQERIQELVREQQLFACIYANLPWPCGRKANPSIPRLVQELGELPIGSLAASQSHLHLWTPPECLEEGLHVLRAWGFDYRASLVRTKDEADYGCYWRQAHEHLLLGVRGNLPFRDSSLPSWIDGHATPQAHSHCEIHDLIERVSYKPYLELSGDYAAPGWTVAGP